MPKAYDNDSGARTPLPLPVLGGQALQPVPQQANALSATDAKDAVRELIRFCGDNPDREGLLDTPERVIKAFRDFWCSGYGVDPSSVLKCFEDGAEGCDEMVLQRKIPIFSLCEHHMAPFHGVAHIAYIPDKRVVGLSKLSRLLDIFARRLQVQERLTNQVADALMNGLNPLGVGVILKCRHSCMESRGVKIHGTETITCAVRGVFKTKPEARAEFLMLAHNGGL